MLQTITLMKRTESTSSLKNQKKKSVQLVIYILFLSLYIF